MELRSSPGNMMPPVGPNPAMMQSGPMFGGGGPSGPGGPRNPNPKYKTSMCTSVSNNLPCTRGKYFQKKYCVNKHSYLFRAHIIRRERSLIPLFWDLMELFNLFTVFQKKISIGKLTLAKKNLLPQFQNANGAWALYLFEIYIVY